MRTIGERIKEQFTFIYKHWKGVRIRTPFFSVDFDRKGYNNGIIRLKIHKNEEKN